MARGGVRPGSGRKPGGQNRKTRERADLLAAEGITPLEYMMQIMRTEPSEMLSPAERASATSLRFEAARSAAPYMHPRLAAIEHTGRDGGPIEHDHAGLPEAVERALGELAESAETISAASALPH